MESGVGKDKMESRASESDSAAKASFEHVYEAHHEAVLGYCARRARRIDAWDAAAEVFAIAWRRASDIPSGDETLPWLLGVAYRVLSNQRRSENRRRRLAVRAAHTASDSPPSPDAQLVRNEEEAEVIAALLRLRPLDREVIQLTLWEELPRDHIANVLGVSRQTLDQRVSRAKKRLAKELERGTRVRRATPARKPKGGAT